MIKLMKSKWSFRRLVLTRSNPPAATTCQFLFVWAIPPILVHFFNWTTRSAGKWTELRRTLCPFPPSFSFYRYPLVISSSINFSLSLYLFHTMVSVVSIKEWICLLPAGSSDFIQEHNQTFFLPSVLVPHNKAGKTTDNLLHFSSLLFYCLTYILFLSLFMFKTVTAGDLIRIDFQL